MQGPERGMQEFKSGADTMLVLCRGVPKMAARTWIARGVPMCCDRTADHTAGQPDSTVLSPGSKALLVLLASWRDSMSRAPRPSTKSNGPRAASSLGSDERRATCALCHLPKLCQPVLVVFTSAAMPMPSVALPNPPTSFPSFAFYCLRIPIPLPKGKVQHS